MERIEKPVTVKYENIYIIRIKGFTRTKYPNEKPFGVETSEKILQTVCDALSVGQLNRDVEILGISKGTDLHQDLLLQFEGEDER